MLFTEGTRIKLRNTGDAGSIIKLLDDEMVNVKLDGDGMVIPVFLEDIIRIEDAVIENKKARIKAKFVKGKEEKSLPKREYPMIDSQYTILKSKGIQLAFDPINREDGTTSKYNIYLINDTRYDIIFSFNLLANEMQKRKLNDKLSSISTMQVGEVPFDLLNDNLTCYLECWQVTTQGTGSKLEKLVKIKPKQFFKKILTAPLLNRRVHLYRVFENFDPLEKNETSEDLKSYTERNNKPQKLYDNYYQNYDTINVEEFADFTSEIDLHIESLIDNHHKMSNSEIIKIQLSHFEAFIEKAIRLGVSRVFVIHGVGKGKLKNEIATRLIKNADVQTFKNDYHPRYAWGATEVIF